LILSSISGVHYFLSFPSIYSTCLNCTRSIYPVICWTSFRVLRPHCTVTLWW